MHKIIFAITLILVGLVAAADTLKSIKVDSPFEIRIECIEGHQFLFVNSNCISITCARPIAVVQIMDDNGKPKKCVE